MAENQSKILFPVRKSGRRKTMKMTEIEDKENSPSKKALRSPEKESVRMVSLSPVRPNSQPELKQIQQASTSHAKNLFATDSPSKTPAQETTPLPDYKGTKNALHTSLPPNLIGRGAESKVLEDFVRGHMQKGSAGSLYMSGAPGTGKTAVLHHALSLLPADLTKVYINCMSHNNSHSIYSSIHSSLHLSIPNKRRSVAKTTTTKMSSQKAVADISISVCASQKSIILVLDEIDSLDSQRQEVLYSIFEWPSLPHSRLILICISNSLDLTNRILPRLKNSSSLLPLLLNFPPYSEADITSILLHRLSQLGDRTAIDRGAIVYCSRKVSSMAGDVRVALDVCRRAVEVVEATVAKGGGQHGPEPALHSTSLKVTIPIMMSVINEVYGQKTVSLSSSSSLSSSASSSSCLPLQQLLLLCTLLMATRQVSNKEVLLGKLHEVYTSVCRRNHACNISLCDLLDVCSNLHDRGLLDVKKHKEVRKGKVSLRVDERELQTMVQDATLVSAILSRGL